MNVLRVTALVIYSFGVFAYTALLMPWYQWASHGQRPDPGAPRTSRQTLVVSGSLWAVSFVWFALNLIVVLTQLAPAPPAPWLRSASLLGRVVPAGEVLCFLSEDGLIRSCKRPPSTTGCRRRSTTSKRGSIRGGSSASRATRSSTSTRSRDRPRRRRTR